MTPLFDKGFFDIGEKVGFTNCIFETLCSSETLFIVFPENTAAAIKNCMLKN